MKNKIVVSLFFLCTFCVAKAQINLTQGLVAYYPFNGNANDASGNNNNPIFNNATLTSDKNGNINSAYHFNGVDSYMQIPNAPTLNMGNTISISAWVRVTGFYYGTCHGNRIVMKGITDNPSTGNYLLTFDDSHYTNGVNCNGGIPDTIHQKFYGLDAYATALLFATKNDWYSLNYTNDGVRAKFYVNCKLVADNPSNLNFTNPYDLFLGKLNNAQYPYWFNGDLDEVRIYNRALSKDEVMILSGGVLSDFSFQQNVCNPKQITFKNETLNTSSFKWDFGNNTTDNTNPNPTVNYANYNNYNVQLIVMQTNDCVDTVTKNIPITNQFFNGLIKNTDTTICLGSSFKLNVQDSGLAYCWSVSNGVANNTTASQVVAPTSNTTYYYNAQTVGNNLIINGDFESGNTGFQSDYAYQIPPNTTEGVYYVGTNVQAWNAGGNNCSDHAGNGNMMMINGSTIAGVDVWKESINIMSNTNYAFSCWLQSIYSTNPAQLKFSINGIQVGALLQASNTPCSWQQFYVVWNSGNNTSANIAIVNQNTVSLGNDFAIDDIQFKPVMIKTDSINVIVKNCAIPCINKPDFSFAQNACNPKQIILKNETPNTSSFNWNFGNSTTDNTNQNPTVNYANYNNYNVQLIVTQTNGCIDTVVKNIPITNQFFNGLIKNIDTTICLGSSFKLNVQDSGLAYCWSVSNGVANNTTASQVVAPTSNTTYYYNAQTVGNNLIINGDFESGNTGFQSDYSYKTPPRTSQGQYYIGNNPNVWFNPFVACKDHTTTTGNMLMLDGSTTVNSAIWKQTIAIQPSTNYVFSGWVQSIVSQDAARLLFKINGNQMGATLTAITTACNWSQYTVVWNSGGNTTANLSIINNNLVVQGNDFAIDDIVFAPITIKTDSVNVVVNNCNVVCKGVVELHGQDKINLPPPQTQYYNATGFTWETWFNSSYYDNNSNTIGTRNKLIAALDLKAAEDILIGFGWVVGAKKKELCFVVDGTETIPFSVANRDNTPCTYFPTGGFVPNTWYHVAGVRDYANNKALLYVNGVLVDTKTNNHTPITREMGGVFTGGTFMGNLLPVVDSGFAGKMDEIRIWNTVRTATEIQTNYNKCLAGNETGLVAYYHSNEKTGSILHDVSPNSNNATLTIGVVLNKSEYAPIINPCTLQSSSRKDTTICQGQSFWGHSTQGQHIDTLVNILGCDSFRTLNLIIANPPTLNITPNTTICYDSVLQLNVAGASSYIWSPKLGLNDSTIAKPIASPKATTTYYVIAKNNVGCTVKDSVIITVLPQVITLITMPLPVCGSVVFNGVPYTKDTLLLLKIDKNSLGCDSIIYKHQIRILQNKTITIPISICTGQNYFGHTTTGVYTKDTIPLATGCDSITLINLIVDKYINKDTTISICFGEKYQNKYTTSGIYYDTLFSSTSCDTIIKINLTVKDKLAPKLIDDASICQGDTLQLYPGKFFFYQWNNGSHQPKITVQNVGYYWVLVKDSLGCQATDSFTLMAINTKPKDFLPISFTTCIGESFTFLNGYQSYHWITGETTPTIALNGLNDYWVKVTNSKGCVGRDTMHIIYLNAQSTNIINAFSPNGDGINEEFKPFNSVCYIEYKIQIFNKWGQKIFQSIDPNKGWNGTFNLQNAPTDVYYYIINFKNTLGINETKSGSVTLLR